MSMANSSHAGGLFSVGVDGLSPDVPFYLRDVVENPIRTVSTAGPSFQRSAESALES